MDNPNQPTKIPEVQSQTPPPVNNSSNTKLLILILAGVAITLIAIGAYVLGTKQNQPVVQNSLQTTPSLSKASATEGIPSPTPDQTANWKTYTNTKYNYQFKYPEKDWVFDWLVPPERNEDIRTFDSISFLKTTTVSDKYVNQTVWWMRFFVAAEPNPNRLTPKEIYYFSQYNTNIPAGLSTNVPFGDQYLKDLRNKVTLEAKYPQGVEDATLLGYTALKQTYRNWGSLTVVKDSLTFVFSWSIEDGKETAENAQQVFDQILSTFKFTDQ